MPTPPDAVEATPNPDGSTTTTTTKFHPNGQPREVTRETKDANGNLREVSRTEFDRQGRKKKETTQKLDEQGRVDETTETEFDNKGEKKETVRTEYDDDERPTKSTMEKFKGGTKTAQATQETDYSAQPPRRVVTEEKLCPDGQRVKLRVTRVFYNRAGTWREERREEKVQRFDCATGREISMLLPGSAENYAAIALAGLSVMAAAAGWARTSNGLWLASLLSAAASAVLFIRRASGRIELEEEKADLAFSICDDDEVAVADVGGPGRQEVLG